MTLVEFISEIPDEKEFKESSEFEGESSDWPLIEFEGESLSSSSSSSSSDGGFFTEKEFEI